MARACAWCGHPKPAHDHDRLGTECSYCAICPQYRGRRFALGVRLLSIIGNALTGKEPR